MQSSIKLSNLGYLTSGHNYNFNKYSLLAVLLKNLHDGSLTPQNADVEQTMFTRELKNVKRGKILDRKIFFLETLDYFLMELKKVLDVFRDGIFPFETTDAPLDNLGGYI